MSRVMAGGWVAFDLSVAKTAADLDHISRNVVHGRPYFIGRGEGFGVLIRPHFAKCGPW